MSKINRSQFLRKGLAAGGALAAAGSSGVLANSAFGRPEEKGGWPLFRISLATWSINSTYQKEWTNIDLPRITREDLGLDGVEIVNQHFDNVRYSYLQQLKQRAADFGVEIVLIMVDGEGDMCHIDRKERMQAAYNHRKWVDIAHYLGCHSIRCNLGYHQEGTPEERIKWASESFNHLLEYSEESGINIIIENHGNISSIPKYLISLMEMVDNRRFGTLPDYGNFPDEVDKYDAVDRLMPYAKAVSVKCVDFGPDGSHPAWDLDRMVKITLDHGYRGFMGIEAGSRQGRHKENVIACRKLLEKYQYA